MAGFDLAGFEDFEEDLGMPRLGAMFSDEEGETFGPPKKDLYAILGVEKDADLESIKKVIHLATPCLFFSSETDLRPRCFVPRAADNLPRRTRSSLSSTTPTRIEATRQPRPSSRT